MENINTNDSHKRSSWKTKLTLILLLLVLGLFAYGYFWFKGVTQRDIEAKQLIETSEKYSILQDSISKEYEDCQQLLTVEEGNFSKFEYCRGFIKFADESLR